MLITLKRVFKSGWLCFSRDGEIATATVFILVMAIFLVSTIFLLKDASQFLIASLQEKVDISVYFKEDSVEEEILNLREELAKVPEVKKIEYLSKETALEEFSQRHKDDPVLMQSLEEIGKNPFLASLNIKACQANQYEVISSFIENSQFKNLIDHVDYYQRKPIIERIFSLTSTANKAGIGLSIILVMLAVLVTFNTTRLAILNCSEEIKIQRLVGASNWFIRGPFLVQGAISGVISALISLLAFSLIFWLLSPKIEVLFQGLNLFEIFVKNLRFLILVQLLTGIGLGVLSSLIAIRKYLRV